MDRSRTDHRYRRRRQRPCDDGGSRRFYRISRQAGGAGESNLLLPLRWVGWTTKSLRLKVLTSFVRDLALASLICALSHENLRMLAENLCQPLSRVHHVIVVSNAAFQPVDSIDNILALVNENR